MAELEKFADTKPPLKDFQVSGHFKEPIDKILNLHFFRKLSGKTQVILSLAGPAVRTRLTHTVEVARIARTICDKLGLNSDLAEAIALAHDIGHTPFGHVGERALKEVMCGCDTLKEKVNDIDFDNSGFKHNLQSFRVLRTLEAVSNHEAEWAYILWGVAAHSKMSWSKPNSGMEDEILISCNHCDRVYSCLYHEKRMCKRNIQHKKKSDSNIGLTCLPYFCAILDTYRNRHDPRIDKLVQPGENKEDYIGWFADEGREKVYCNKKCYLAELWEHKINCCEIVGVFPYLYDHPFPNSFYGPDFFEFFNNSIKAFISVEALVVSQADEIAQRQQDLEDAVSAGLISFEMAEKDVNELIGETSTAKNQKELGERIVKFYSESLIETTKKKFSYFVSQPKSKPKLNFYCLINLLYQLCGDDEKRNQWIITELNKKQSNRAVDPYKMNFIESFFEIDYDDTYFFSIVYDFLDNELKFGKYERCIEILKQFEQLFVEKIGIKRTTNVIEMLVNLKEFSRKFSRQRYSLRDIDLYPFHLLYQIYSTLPKNIDVIDALKSLDFKAEPSKYEKGEVFAIWRETLGAEANSVLANIVTYKEKESEKRFKEFEKNQKNNILKSELVEKNDGKANYILKRLFSAFITNSHQLPDTSLNFILLALSNKENNEKFFNDELSTFIKILGKLKKTTIYGFDEIMERMNRQLIKLDEAEFNNIKSSNEIKALIEKRKDLFDFFVYFKKVSNDLSAWVRSEQPPAKNNSEFARRMFRGILDNPILNAMPYWKSLLTRGIVDYIASLTDQEAIDQYEKLYASAMDLI